MTTRSQKRKAAEELLSTVKETPLAENNSEENLIAAPSELPRMQFENLDEIKTSLTKKIMSDFSKILAENQKEMLKLKAPVIKIRNNHLDIEDLDSETENALPTMTSKPVKIKTTARKNTPTVSRNSRYS